MDIEKEMKKGIIRQIKKDGHPYSYCPSCQKVQPVEIEYHDKDGWWQFQSKCLICKAVREETIQKIPRKIEDKKEMIITRRSNV